MKKLLKCMVMAVASIGLAFTGCKIDDGGSTPVFLPIGGSGSSSVVAAEVSISGVTNESVIYTAGETANAFKVSYSIISKDSTHLEGDVLVSDHALITWLSCIAHVACHAVITWLSCTTHLADHAMIM